ncbi:glutamate/tyrosine decarboxylase-like PLP-dependent enzyme [Lewinella marina]|uniref:Aspartate aminotransferase family protein n=1 Tax=Neolewinella marina TaxID=438751 RepID=A0A2G0CB89_9BACT|nr:pyridoxal-dependent decarboxylase [Neolewinella marina]NJB87762.1 glutamate/tyrosine decarboxylase-like PLP-dependent enzyme [Neolewinella marina]PHK97233.1 aspartate aminotransferase family protein [Neolewinella marina]
MPTSTAASRRDLPLHQDHDALPDILSAVLEEASHFLATLPQRRAGARVPFAEQLPPTHFRGGFIRGTKLPYDAAFGEGRGALATLRHCVRRFDDVIVASASPRYLGYVTGGVTPAALAGDWLASVYDQNPQGLRWFGDTSGRIEYETVGMLRELLGLPVDFHGGFVSGATMSNFTCLATARQWLGDQHGEDVASQGLRRPVRVYAATPHSSVRKALSMLGLGTEALVPVATLPDREAMNVEDLARQLALHPDEPSIVVASGGTVNTADFDDFRAIAELRDRHPFWLHIDAAFGGFAALLPESADPVPAGQYPGGRLRGWEAADSITVDNHKWLNVPYDSGTWFIRKTHEALQTATFHNGGGAAYLGVQSADYNYLNLGPENSRRLRALPVWFTLKAYGKAGYRDIVSRCVAAAHALGRKLTESAEFELLAPVRLNVVAFAPRGGDPTRVNQLLQRLNDNGRYFLSPVTLDGRAGLRAAFVNWRISDRDVTWLFSELQQTWLGIDSPAPAPAPPKP